jgi:hypothetical protein
MARSRYRVVKNQAGEELLRRLRTGPASAPRLDPSLLAEAQASFLAARLECARDARRDVDDLKSRLARAAADGPEYWPAHLAEMSARTRALAGSASSFGYPVAEHVAVSLQRFIAHRDAKSEGALEEFRLHVEALARIFAEDIKGDGGQQGRELVAMCARWNEKAFA